MTWLRTLLLALALFAGGALVASATYQPNVPAYAAWTAYTPTGTWSANVTWTGAYRRVGDTMEAYALASCSGGPTGTFTVNVPNSETVDESKLVGSIPVVGYGFANDSGTFRGPILVRYDTSANTIDGIICTTAPSTGTNVSASVPVSFGSTDYVIVRFMVPITGW